MSNRTRPLPSLRRYLLFWFAGSAIVMVFAYTQLLEYYLEVGIDLRTQAFLERTAEKYAESHAQEGTPPDLPGGPNLSAYLELSAVPSHILAVFPLDELEHGEALRFVNLDFDVNDEKEFSVDTGNFCVEGICELIFLYAYQLNQDDWLCLINGIVGSEEVYDELEFTDQFAFAIGSLFAGLLLLVSLLLVRNIDRPLRRLNAWSAAQSVEGSAQAIPELRFSELDELANRIGFAFERMREGINKEKLFLRHASHELRTPIAILSSNVELIDRLTDRAERSEAEQAAFVRQYRALEDVQLLIETLLWVNRQSDNLPKSEPLDLHGELESIVENYRYLLDRRDVSVTLVGAGVATVPVAAARIVLSNLVRNAFQYTVDGEVRITVAQREVSVENVNSEAQTDDDPQHDDEDGFGLGLELVSLICQRFAWRCDATEIPGGRSTVVGF